MDTLIFSDLEELFNIDLEDNFFCGFSSYDNNSIYNNFNFPIEKRINTNILLINTKKLSEDNKVEKLKQIYKKYKENPNMNEKAMINIIFNNDTSILPENMECLILKALILV